MSSSTFAPRPGLATAHQDDPPGGPHNNPGAPYPGPSTHPQSQVLRAPRSILRPPNSPSSHSHYNLAISQQPPRPQIPHNSRTTASSSHHHHTASSPELRPRVDTIWAPRVRQQRDIAQTGYTPGPVTQSHVPRIPGEFGQRRNTYGQLGDGRVRSFSELRTSQTPVVDLEGDRLARACGQPAEPSRLRGRRQEYDDAGTNVAIPRPEPSRPPVPKMKPGHMYRRLDALARRSNHRAMDYLSLEDVGAMHKRDDQLREQLRRKRSERMQDRDSSFHAIGTPLEDVLLYASASIAIGDFQHDLPIVVVACVEELTKTGIYQSGLFRALPSRDRHLQLIDIFDKSADFGAHFSMRGQTMPDVCALLSTFLSSLPSPLIDPHIYSALWQWSVKPSVKKEDARREQQEAEEEERRAKSGPPRPNFTEPRERDDLHLATDGELEGNQICIAQILLRFVPVGNLSLLIYLLGFFTQLPLCPDNGIHFEDIARIFGYRLLGGSTKPVSQKMMMWLLTRWPQISEMLLAENCGMSPPSSPMQPSLSVVPAGEEANRRPPDQNEKRKVSGDRSSESPLNAMSSLPPDSPEDLSSSKKSSSDDEDGDYGGNRYRKKRELNTEQGGSQSRRHSTRKDKSAHRGRRSSRRSAISSQAKNSPVESENPFATAFANAQNELSGMPLLASPPASASEGTSQQSSSGRLLIEARVRISRLESELRRNDVVVVDAIKETFKAHDEARLLSDKVESLEKILRDRDMRAKATYVPDDDDGLELQSRLMGAERDKARKIMKEMRSLLDGRPMRLT
ncbi:hypothetical protein PAXRUDRAFT_159955 [Paxillus rubicundulus Ve08.2h10]|uniref:Rho-GAP domain-containing protein n=1 Tax=Paxillus rubicundulus Ve08.2h10 TaxID=930991 RepID=A0A0D0DN63_9AGAM|nr:hypothetical protein PAXRUDRAFT_159955 [Paxillus rubicundulus Ve08.2h10]